MNLKRGPEGKAENILKPIMTPKGNVQQFSWSNPLYSRNFQFNLLSDISQFRIFIDFIAFGLSRVLQLSSNEWCFFFLLPLSFDILYVANILRSLLPENVFLDFHYRAHCYNSPSLFLRNNRTNFERVTEYLGAYFHGYSQSPHRIPGRCVQISHVCSALYLTAIYQIHRFYSVERKCEWELSILKDIKQIDRGLF